MTFTSLSFFVLIVIAFIAYFLFPIKKRWIVLLVASYLYYYFASSLGLMVYIIVTTASVFALARVMDRISSKSKAKISELDHPTKEQKNEIKARAMRDKKLCAAAGLLFNLGILAYFKYLNFIILNIDSLFNVEIPTSQLLVPLGISFYTFQSTSYLIDVYREKIPADKNIAKFALFTSFFPQIIQGPISRYDQLAHQLYEGHRFDYTRIKHGMMLMIWGYFQKLVIADRAFVLVQYMISHYTELKGMEVAIGMVAIAVRSYADFAGGIDICRGVAQIFGVDMVQNFARPYFSISIRDYWSRWHVTLGQWFRDYFYYSLLFSKGWRKFITWSKKHLGTYFGKLLPVSIGMAFTFFLVGVWHGAEWKFILFGVYNGVLVMIGIITMPWLTNVNKKYNLVKTDAFSWRIFLSMGMFVIICFSKLITGMEGPHQTFTLAKALFSEFNPQIFWDGSIYKLGLSSIEFKILIVATIVLFVVDLIRERGRRIRISLDKQNMAFRWFLIIACIVSVLIVGMYGDGSVKDFIYQRF